MPPQQIQFKKKEVVNTMLKNLFYTKNILNTLILRHTYLGR